MADSRGSSALTVVPQRWAVHEGGDLECRARLREALVRVGAAAVCAIGSLGQNPKQVGDLGELERQLRLAREALRAAEALSPEIYQRVHPA